MTPEQFEELMQVIKCGFVMVLLTANAILLDLWQSKVGDRAVSAEEKAYSKGLKAMQFGCLVASGINLVMVLL